MSRLVKAMFGGSQLQDSEDISETPSENTDEETGEGSATLTLDQLRSNKSVSASSVPKEKTLEPEKQKEKVVTMVEPTDNGEDHAESTPRQATIVNISQVVQSVAILAPPTTDLNESLKHLKGIVRDVQIYNLDGIAASCNIRTIKTTKTIELVSVSNNTIIASVQNDVFSSGEHLAAVAIATILLDAGVKQFQVDLNIMQRIATINNSKVFDVAGEDAYQTYMRKLTVGEDESNPVEIDLADVRNTDDGRWDVGQMKLYITTEKRGKELAVYFFDVEERDIPNFRELEGTLYFQAPRLYTHRDWKKAYTYVLDAQRNTFPATCCEHKTLPRLAIREISSSPLYPMTAGPECVKSIDALRQVLEEALRAEVWTLPEVMGKPTVIKSSSGQNPQGAAAVAATFSSSDVSKEAIFRQLCGSLKPDRSDYEMLQQAIFKGQTAGKEFLKAKGIDETRDVTRIDIFGSCLSTNRSIPSAYRRQLNAANEHIADPVSRFHKYIQIFSVPGPIQDASRVPPQPIKVAIWHMIRSYSQARLTPATKLDYEWCLEA